MTSTVWTLSGVDADQFLLDQGSGAIRFKKAPNNEEPRDSDGNNRYEVTLSVSTFDRAGNEKSASQDLEINVTDVSIVLGGVSKSPFNVPENRNEVITQITHTIDEDDFKEVKYSLAGRQSHLFRIDQKGNLEFAAPPNFELRHLDFGDDVGPKDVIGALYSVKVVVTATWEDGRATSAEKLIFINLLDEPEAPKISLERNPGFYVLTTERSELRDTGFRVFATDDDGDPFTLSLNGNTHFRLLNGNQVWVRKKKTFDLDGGDGFAVQVRAKETDPEGKTAILLFTIPIKQRLDDIDDMFRIVGEAEVEVDENLDIAYRPAVAWGEEYRSSMPIVWSLEGADSGLLRIDAATGVVRFVAPPDYESGKRAYDFTIKAAGVGGQLVNRKVVTVNIQDVDDNAPDEMMVIGFDDDNEFAPEELERSANRKLAKIRFVDVDSPAGNDVEIDGNGRAFFEIRPATHANGDIKTGVYRLWLKDGVTLEAGSYAITMTAVINDVRDEDMQQTFTFTVATPDQPDEDVGGREPETHDTEQDGSSLNDDVDPPRQSSDGNANGNRSTEVVNVEGALDDDPLPLPADVGLSVDVM